MTNKGTSIGVSDFRTIIIDNIYCVEAVMTGILRVAKESIFSGLNNINDCTVIDEYAAGSFGFTEDEVKWNFLLHCCYLRYDNLHKKTDNRFYMEYYK